MRPLVLPRHGRCARRTLLKTALGGVFLAPFLRQRALEAKAAAPKRLVLVFTPDAHPREWWPATDAGGALELGAPLGDFAGLESELLFVRQLDHSWTFDNHHEAGVAQVFTGARFFDDATHYANGPSLEQVLLQNTDLRGGTPISDVHLAVADPGDATQRHVICYSGPGQPIPHEASPARAFAKLFSGLSFGDTSPPKPAESALEQRIRSTLFELDRSALRELQTHLGTDERERLDVHLDALEELERRARTADAPSTTPAVGCERVSTGGITQNDRDADNVTKWGEVQVDLLVNAFLCDRTRVGDLAFGSSGSQHGGLLGLVAGEANSWHELAHLSQNDTTRKSEVTLGGDTVSAAAAYGAFDRFWASRIAYLAKRLRAIPEGDGTMLDNTLIYWGAECGTDHNHAPADMQYLLIGGRNLGFQSGQLLRLPSPESAHKLHTSVLHAFGHVDAMGFGIEPTCGPLAGVLG
ncbi:MAG TPA: DUF1552 domain-containing protein [Polyangiaceae bacterium]|nr:DUF1552 domain-containing protein [Polyangiaceae bacterium]